MSLQGRRLLLAGVPIVAVLAGVAGIVSTARPQQRVSATPASPHPRASETALALGENFPCGTPAICNLPLPQPTPFVAPEEFTNFVPSSLSFANNNDGWVVGQGCDARRRCETVAARTSDGGSSWRAVATPMDPQSENVGVTAASGSDAWIYGRGSEKTPFLLETHDGGATWHEVDLHGAFVIDIAVASESVWVETGCPPESGRCPTSIMSAPAGGGPWAELGVLPASVQEPPYSDARQANPQLVRVGSRAWIVERGAGDSNLLRSDSGGHSWRELPQPCASASDIHAAATSTTHLLLACSFFIGMGPSQPQEVWSSHDGGASWALRSRRGFDTWTPPRPDRGSLHDGIPVDLAALDGVTAWMVNQPGDLVVTHDDGVTWSRPSLPADLDAAVDGGLVEGVMFADPRHGWIYTGEDLWTTIDGGVHWKQGYVAISPP